jgi:hypothetical protein
MRVSGAHQYQMFSHAIASCQGLMILNRAGSPYCTITIPARVPLGISSALALLPMG